MELAIVPLQRDVMGLLETSSWIGILTCVPLSTAMPFSLQQVSEYDNDAAVENS